MNEEKKEISKLKDKRKEKIKVRDGDPIKITNSELRDIINYNLSEKNPSLNPYNRIMSSYDISPRLMNKCQYLASKIGIAVSGIEENRQKLLRKYCKKDEEGKEIMLHDENEVEIRLVEHFAKLAEADKETNVTNLIVKGGIEETRKQIIDSLPMSFLRYGFDENDEVKFSGVLNDLLAQKAELDDMKKIVIVEGDLPERFFNAYERSLLASLFEFDDVEV